MKLPSALRRLSAACFATLVSVPVFATTYYVDSAGGSDANAGTSSGTAWQSLAKVNGVASFVAGDSILFIRGGSWTGRLAPRGSGNSSAAITIDNYGDAGLPLPLIEGNGATYAAVLLQNQQYWDVKNIEVTNNSPTAGSRVGVHILGTNAGAIHHIHLVGLEVHDVNGNATTNGGIFFEITGTTTPTYFDDVLVDSCYVHDCTQRGINGPYSTWDDRTPTTNTTWTPSLNVIIRNNVVTNSTNQGIICRVSTNPLMEHNLMANNGQGGSGNAMFVFNTDGAVMQYNEAYGQQFNTGDTDAAGFDIDYRTKNTIVQYNYAHDNGQGGVTVTAGDVAFNVNPIVRYNILQNNLRRGMHFSGTIGSAQVYNNTIYIGSALPQPVVVFNFKTWNGWPDGTKFYNNIIDNQSTGASYVFGSATNTGFDYNVFYNPNGAATAEPSDAHKLTGDPLFFAPGTGGNGMNTVDGYKLLTGSTSLTSGKVISGNGGLDYYGNTVSASAAPNRGAYNGPGVSLSQVVATPTISPPGGTFTSSTNVTITTSTSGATIRYTTDGSTPTSTTGTIYSGAFAVATSVTVKAIAYKSGLTDSTVASETFVYTVASPVLMEAENLSRTTSGATASVITDASSSNGLWVSLASTASGQYMQFTTTSIPAGTYQLKLDYKGYTARGKCDITIDGVQIGGTLDQYDTATTYHHLAIGNVTFATTTTHSIRLTVNGKNASSTSYALAADLFTFAPPPIKPEAEELAVTSSGPAFSVIGDSNATGGAWSYFASTAIGDSVTYTTTNIPAGTYSVKLRYKAFTSRGKCTLKVDGVQIGGTLDQYASVTGWPTNLFGNVTFATGGTHTITLTVNGQNVSSSGFGLSADQFTLTPQ